MIKRYLRYECDVEGCGRSDPGEIYDIGLPPGWDCVIVYGKYIDNDDRKLICPAHGIKLVEKKP